MAATPPDTHNADDLRFPALCCGLGAAATGGVLGNGKGQWFAVGGQSVIPPAVPD